MNPNIDVKVRGPQAIADALRSYKTVILKPNVQDNRNVLTQEMMSTGNTKYVIQWNYDLQGETINVPAGCIIEFNGGTVYNGTIIGNNTILLYDKNIDELFLANREGTFIYNATVADEEDITSETGQLKFKDKAYAPANYSGLGRKILRKNIVNDVNTLTQEMVSDANTIYVIQYDFTLSENITVPANCVLEFDGGSLSNGNIMMNNTVLSGKIHFNDIVFAGNIKCDGIIDDRCYLGGDDNNMLQWLIKQAAYNNITLSLHRDYTINPKEFAQFSSIPFVSIENNDGFSINGNGHTIYNNYVHGENKTRILVLLKSCNNITVSDLYFVDNHNEANTIVGSTQELRGHTGGTTVLRFARDSNNINVVGAKCRNCFSYLWCGIDPIVVAGQETELTDNFVVKGFTNVNAQVDAYNTSYPVAIYVGSNIAIKTTGYFCHRITRIQGVDNGTLDIKGAYTTTPTMLLIADGAGYTDDTFETRKFLPCSNIYATIENLYNVDDADGQNWYDVCAYIKSYDVSEDIYPNINYRTRDTAYYFKNINVEFRSNLGNDGTGVYVVPNKKSDIEDVYEINIHNSRDSRVTVVGSDSIDNLVNVVLSDSVLPSIDGGLKDNVFITLKKSTVDYVRYTLSDTQISNPILLDGFSAIGNENTNGFTINRARNYLTKPNTVNNNVQLSSDISYIIPDNSSVLNLNVSPNNFRANSKHEIWIYNKHATSIPIIIGGVITMQEGFKSFVLQTLECLTLTIIKDGSDLYGFVTRGDRQTYTYRGNHNDLGFKGAMLFDTALGVPCFYTGTQWVDALGYTPTKGGTRRYGTTLQRPASTDIYDGFQYFDTDLSKPIWWNGTAWVDTTGTPV